MSVNQVRSAEKIYFYPERTDSTHRVANVYAAGRPAGVTS